MRVQSTSRKSKVNSHQSQRGFHHVVLLLAIVIIGVVGIAGWRVFSSKKDTSGSAPKQSASKTAEAIKFSENIFDPATTSFIGPLGELNGGYEEATATAGITINIKPEAVTGGKMIEVKAPTAMSLDNYAYYKVGSEPNTWTLYFRLSPTLTMRMDHILRASDKIVEATTSTPKSDSRSESPKRKVSFKAGEIVAYTSGTANAHNWNIYVFDDGHQNKFINQARYENSSAGKQMLQAACVFDYYEPAAKAAYIALMGARKAGESSTCGEVSRDKAGTLSGMWHFSADSKQGMEIGKDGRYESPFSIYKNSAGVISINQIDGKRIDVEPGARTNKDPAEVTSEHCYEGSDAYMRPAGYVYLKLVDDKQMSLAYSPIGSCPASFPTSSAKTYYR